MKKVLIICTENSCMSILAEAIINHYKGNRYMAFCAGSQPSSLVNEDALKCLIKHGIKTDYLKSKSWEFFSNQDFDYVITVCDSVDINACPTFAGKYKKIHWSIPDPSLIAGDAAEKAKAFDKTFNLLFKKIDQELL